MLTDFSCTEVYKQKKKAPLARGDYSLLHVILFTYIHRYIYIRKSSPRRGKEDVSIIFCVLSLPPHIIPTFYYLKLLFKAGTIYYLKLGL